MFITYVQCCCIPWHMSNAVLPAERNLKTNHWIMQLAHVAHYLDDFLQWAAELCRDNFRDIHPHWLIFNNAMIMIKLWCLRTWDFDATATMQRDNKWSCCAKMTLTNVAKMTLTSKWGWRHVLSFAYTWATLSFECYITRFKIYLYLLISNN